MRTAARPPLPSIVPAALPAPAALPPAACLPSLHLRLCCRRGRGSSSAPTATAPAPARAAAVPAVAGAGAGCCGCCGAGQRNSRNSRGARLLLPAAPPPAPHPLQLTCPTCIHPLQQHLLPFSSHPFTRCPPAPPSCTCPCILPYPGPHSSSRPLTLQSPRRSTTPTNPHLRRRRRTWNTSRRPHPRRCCCPTARALPSGLLHLIRPAPLCVPTSRHSPARAGGAALSPLTPADSPGTQPPAAPCASATPCTPSHPSTSIPAAPAAGRPLRSRSGCR